MFPAPVAHLSQNTLAYETTPLIRPSGFREYDARWLFGEELNLMGVQLLGAGIGTLVHELGVKPEIVVGHDYRSYSGAIKIALVNGLMASGLTVHDIGLALSPMAYFAQFELDVAAVAMVTASHNENGWTGVKMGVDRPLTFGPDEMTRLKDIVLSNAVRMRPGGSYRYVADLAVRYADDLAARPPFKRRIRVVAACGNGTAGAFAPSILSRLGVDVLPLDAELDHTFPRYNPNPEDMKMLHAIRDAVLESGADVGLGFDGDGDRCGVVDNEGEEIFADKIGVMLARDLSTVHEGARFVVDVKSTGLFRTDPVLLENGASTEYWKTGHSYLKRRVREKNALAGFEKSGHYFFNAPLGRGYDDGLVSAIAILDMLERNPAKSMAELRRALPMTWGTPTMSPGCADERKYGVIERVTARIEAIMGGGETIDGHRIVEITKVNGIRLMLDDGTWGLVRASSNKPELVVVVESPVSEQRMRAMFHSLDAVLRKEEGIGPYNQTI